MSHSPALLDVPPPEVADRVRSWMVTEMTASHPLLGRPGPVCPYLAASLARDLVVVGTRTRDPSQEGKAAVAALVEDAIEMFRSRAWPSQREDLRAVVAVVPDMPRGAWPLIDSMHAEMKTAAVAQGLMIGQFHPDCPAGAVRNADFRVLRSPYPMIVVRAMAVHDIQFLADNPAWYRAYHQRFGRRLAEPGSPVALAALYFQARARFGDPADDAAPPLTRQDVPA